MNNNPLNTIFKSKNKSKLKTLLETQIRPFQNNEINRIQARYQNVFSQIMSIFSESKFYHDVFLPRMSKRNAFMRMNRKFMPLTQEQFEEQKEKLDTSNTYDEYSHRQDIPLFTYITNDPDQFENWSAIRIFEWWRSLRMSRIPKREWLIFDAVKYLFINQFMRIMNSYLKYGVVDKRNRRSFINTLRYGVDKRDKLAFGELIEYLRLVDIFYENKGQYQHLLNVQLGFCEWFSTRFIGGLLFESGQNSDKKYVSSGIYFNKKENEYKTKIIEYFSLTCKNDNGILLIPLSFFQKESKFINTYTAPLIVFLGINYRTHNENNDFYKLYSPYGQIYHDFIIHAEILIDNYNNLYGINKFNNKILLLQNNDILLFEKRCKFLTIVSLINNDEFKKLLWFILHEISFLFFKEFMLFFYIDILFKNLNDIKTQTLLKNYLIPIYKYSEILILDSIYTLIYACIIFFMSNFLPLEYFKDLKITVESIVFWNNPNNISNKLIKILRKEKLLIEFEYDVKTKQLKLRSISDYNLLKGILELQSKGISLIHNQYCFESYLLSPNTIQACDILSGCAFFNDVFLPKMRERVAKNRVIMRVDNKKFSKLSEVNFRTKKYELRMKTNSFEKYQERYDTPLFTYIYEDKDQFENWSAIRIFEWWRNLRMSGTQYSIITQKIPKQEWPIFESVKYLFINQILHILNSYRKYGITDQSYWAFTELQEYLRLVDIFYRSGGQYQHLLNAHLAFCNWFSARFIGGLLFERSQSIYVNSKEYNNLSKNFKKLRENAIKEISEMFVQSLTDKNYILIIPLSYFQKESKFINKYSAPIIQFLGINYRTHSDLLTYYVDYSPKNQITHDFVYHSKIICSSYSQLYPNENYSDIRLFSQRCKFLTIVSLIDNDDLKKLLWYILHEIFFFNETEINFFDFNILFKKLNEEEINNLLLPLFNDKLKLTQSIYTLICACIIFFMFQSFSLKEISQISIEINGLITSVSLNDTQLVILEINSMLKQVRIKYLNKDVINQKIMNSFSHIIQQFGWSIVDSQQNTQKQINMYKKQIGNIYTKMLELKQSQPNL